MPMERRPIASVAATAFGPVGLGLLPFTRLKCSAPCCQSCGMAATSPPPCHGKTCWPGATGRRPPLPRPLELEPADGSWPSSLLPPARQKGRVPLAQAIPRQPLVVPVVATWVMEPLARPGHLRVGVDGALRSQHPRSSDIRCWTSVNTPPENGGSRQAETWQALPHWFDRSSSQEVWRDGHTHPL